MEKEINIFTLNWNGKEKLEKLYPTLVKEFSGLNYKWFIKDNGSKDGSVEYLESIKSDRVIPFYRGHNLDNFSQGMNFLFEHANPSGYIVALNNDLYFGENNSIQNMINIMEKDSSVGVVGCRILYPETNKMSHAGIIMSHMYGDLPFHYRYKEDSDESSKNNREFQAVTAACFLTTAEVWKKAGGWDPGFFWCFDDVDFCFSVKYNLGKKIVYCGNTEVFHEESASLKKNPVNKMMMPQSVSKLKLKWGNKYTIDHDMYLNNKNYKLYVC